MSMFAKRLTALASVVTTLAMTFAPVATHAATTAFQAGDLIKGTQFSTVYYFGPDGRRYVFPNDKTYFTWYADFSTVKTIPDSMLQTIPLGRSNITYRPGVKMVKIDTDPKTYAVDQGGVLRWVKSEELAKTLFGLNWNQRIDDVPDPFFINYKVGTPIESADQYPTEDIKTATPNIAIDKQFDMTMVTVTIGSATAGGFVPASTTVKVGSTVTWTNADIVPHTVTGDAFDSGTIEKTKTYTRTFNTVGSYDYHDAIYPTMLGTINVVQ